MLIEENLCNGLQIKDIELKWFIDRLEKQIKDIELKWFIDRLEKQAAVVFIQMIITKIRQNIMQIQRIFRPLKLLFLNYNY